MIDIAKGEFRLDQRELVLHPGLRLSEFKEGILKCASSSSAGTAASSFHFSGTIDGLLAEFGVFFVADRLAWFFFERTEQKEMRRRAGLAYSNASRVGTGRLLEESHKWGLQIDQLQKRNKEENDRWLDSMVGKALPYYENWGHLLSERCLWMDDNAIVLVAFLPTTLATCMTGGHLDAA